LYLHEFNVPDDKQVYDDFSLTLFLFSNQGMLRYYSLAIFLYFALKQTTHAFFRVSGWRIMVRATATSYQQDRYTSFGDAMTDIGGCILILTQGLIFRN